MPSHPPSAPRGASSPIPKATPDAAPRHVPTQAAPGGVLQVIAKLLAEAGSDVPRDLYNEALQLGHDGKLREARARLHVLLGLRPSDGEALLLLARVHVGGQQWRAALATLDEAAACHAKVPPELRDLVVQNLQGEVAAHDEEATRAVREAAEVQKLRHDVRRLRSENLAFQQQHRQLERETARWTWIATGCALCAIVLMGVQMALGSGGSAAAEAGAAPAAEVTMRSSAAPATAPDPAAAATAAEPAAAVPDVPAAEVVPADPLTPSAQNASAADSVKAALAAAGHVDVSVVVRGSRASLSGDVPDHASLKAVLEVVRGVPGVTEVLADGLENRARRKGATHTVKGGESLSIIAYRYYGDQSLTAPILDANPRLGGKPNLQIDQELVIPPVAAKR